MNCVNIALCLCSLLNIKILSKTTVVQLLRHSFKHVVRVGLKIYICCVTKEYTLSSSMKQGMFLCPFQ